MRSGLPVARSCRSSCTGWPAAWLAEHALVVDAVRHAVLVRDWESAARYAVDDLAIPTLLSGPQTEALHEALAKIPASAEGAAVAVVGAARAVAAEDWKGAASRLQRARELLDQAGGDSWPAGELAVAVVELVRASHTGDAQAALDSAATAQGMIPVQDAGRRRRTGGRLRSCRPVGVLRWSWPVVPTKRPTRSPLLPPCGTCSAGTGRQLRARAGRAAGCAARRPDAVRRARDPGPARLVGA